MVARDATTLPEPIKAFHKFMEDVREAAILLKNQGYRERGGKIGGQKDGEYIQDKVDLTDLENTSFDVENCASCRHRFLLPVGRDIVEITRYNQQVRSQHTKAMMIWHSASRSRKASKPQAGKSITQQLACMCQKLHCLSNNTGHGCFTCEQACKNAIAAGRNDRPYFDKDFKCVCPVCACECSVLYYRHQGKSLATQAQKDRDEALGQKKQPTMDAFYQFTKKIVESNNEQYEEQYEEIEDVKEEECTNNAMGMVAVKMMDDETIQNDNIMRYGLQKRVGDLETTSSNGESIQTLREKRRKKMSFAKIKETAHLSPERKRGALTFLRDRKENFDEEQCSVITPVPRMKDSRWYRGDLTDLKMETKVNPNFSIDKKMNDLESKVMRRLIDVISPTSPQKQQAFQKMVNKDTTVSAVLKVAVQMNATVDDTKNMVLNNCL